MTITELKADINFLCGSTSASYPVADKIRNLNQEYQRVAVAIDQATDAWQFDDSNATAARTTYITLADASASYEIATTLFRIEGVEIKDSSGDWQKLTPFDTVKDLSISREEFLSSKGLSLYYDLEGNNIRLFPPPGTAWCGTTTAMAVRASRNVTEFPTTAGTAIPGFSPPFHRILSLAVAIDFVKDKGERDRLLQMKDRLERGLVIFYSRRNSELKKNIQPHRNWRQYQ